MNKTMTRGDDETFRITITDEDSGLPIDITGCTITLTLRLSYSAAVFLTKSFSLTDPENGIADVTIVSSDTSGLTAGVEHKYKFDIELTNLDTTKETLVKGNFIITPDVTYS